MKLFSTSCNASSSIQVGSPDIPNIELCDYTEIASTEFSSSACECNGQAYVNEDCTAGFSCMDALPNGQTGDGCLYQCDPGFRLFPTFSDIGTVVTWACVDEDEVVCPGEYNKVCPPDEVDPISDSCDCPGELLVSGDCQSAALCETSDRKLDISCPGTQVI